VSILFALLQREEHHFRHFHDPGPRERAIGTIDGA
jgi:hypothetical protein